MHKSEKIKNTIYNVSILAGQIQIKYFNQQINVIEKESQSNILTEVDLKCNQVIVQYIKEYFPDDNIISEEIGYEVKYSIDINLRMINIRTHIKTKKGSILNR